MISLSKKQSPFDRRKLVISIRYCDLSEGMSCALAEDWCSAISDLFGSDCVLDWKLNGHGFREIVSALEKFRLNNGCFFLELWGFVKTEKIRNKTTLRKHLSDFIYSSKFDHGPDCSLDYEEYYAASISPVLSDADLLKTRLLDLYNLSSRPDLGNHGAQELFGFFSCTKSEDNDLYYGEIWAEIMLESLGAAVDVYAERLLEIGKRLEKHYQNLLISVFRGHNAKQYASLFGENPAEERHPIVGLDPYRSVMEIGWAHVLPRRVVALLNSKDMNEIIVEKNSPEYSTLRLKKSISRVDIPDLKQMKTVLYPVLLRSRNSFSKKRTYFRRFWEDVPVFDDEIEIFYDRVIFCHQSHQSFNQGTVNSRQSRQSRQSGDGSASITSIRQSGDGSVIDPGSIRGRFSD